MLIISVEQIGKYHYKVTFDTGYVLVLYPGDLQKFGIKEGNTLPADKFNILIEKIVLKRAKAKILQLLKISDKSEYEIQLKLRQKYYPADVIQKAIEYAKDYDYINDSRVVSQIIKSRIARKSKREIVAYLRGKGIDSELIEHGFQGIEQDEMTVVRKLLQKKVKPGEAITPEKSTKLYGYLLRKGFNPSTIMRCMKELGSLENDEYDNFYC